MQPAKFAATCHKDQPHAPLAGPAIGAAPSLPAVKGVIRVNLRLQPDSHGTWYRHWGQVIGGMALVVFPQ